jgi:hypothetical protein
MALTWVCAWSGLRTVFWSGCHISNEKRARLRVHEVSTVITEFTVDQDRCPRTQEDLLASNLSSETLVDPWGTSLFFSCSSRAIVVISAGPDRRFQTADDVLGVHTLDAGPVSNPETEPRAPS